MKLFRKQIIASIPSLIKELIFGMNYNCILKVLLAEFAKILSRKSQKLLVKYLTSSTDFKIGIW